jgi:hypothetical protein
MRCSPELKSRPRATVIVLPEQSDIMSLLLQPERKLAAEDSNATAKTGEARSPHMKFHRTERAM